MTESTTSKGSRNAPLLVAFLIIALLIVLCQTVSVYMSTKQIAMEASQKDCEIQARILTKVMSDPVSMGEYDHLQQIIEIARQADPNLMTIHLLSRDGIVLATSQKEFKNRRLNQTDFDKQTLLIHDFQTRSQPGSSDWEVDGPITTASEDPAVLRVIGASSDADAKGMNASLTFLLISVGLVAIGALIFKVLIDKLLQKNDA